MNVSFNLSNKPNKKGEDLIMLMVSRSDFFKPIKRSTGIKVNRNLKHWDFDQQQVKKGDKEQNSKNNLLDKIKTRINDLPTLYRVQKKRVNL